MATDINSLDDCKAALKLSDDDSFDDEIRVWSKAATDAIVDFLGRDPRLQEYTETVYGSGHGGLLLHGFPISDVSSVVLGGTTLDPASYQLRPWGLELQDRVAERGQVVQVSYRAGVETTPPRLKIAHLMTLRAMWDARDIDLNASGETFAGVDSKTYQPEGPGAIPRAAQTMLQSLRRVL